MRNLKLKDKFFALILSLLTVLSPAVSAIPVYAPVDSDKDVVENQPDNAQTENVLVESVTGDGIGVIVTNSVCVINGKDGAAKSVREKRNGNTVAETKSNSVSPFAFKVKMKKPKSVDTARAGNSFDVATYSVVMDSGALTSRGSSRVEFKQCLLCS
jgi:hypothetical protein